MKKVVAVLLVLLLPACGSNKMNAGEMGGAAVGSVLGAYLGAQFGGGKGELLAIGVGALIGGVVGFNFGHVVNPSDARQMSETAEKAMEEAADGQLMNWVNPVTGSAGTVTPVRSYFSADGDYCRDYKATIAIPNAYGAGHGQACRRAGGVWHFAGKA